MDNWTIVIISLLFSAFFSGMEIAFVSSNKLKIELDKNKGLFSAKILSVFFKEPSRLLGALLLGNNISLVIYGIAMADILEPVIINSFAPSLPSESIILIFQTIISTLFILIAGEFIPKALFRINPNRLLNLLALPLKLYYWLFYPIIHFIVWISEFILNHIFRLKLVHQNYTFSPTDLDHYLKEFAFEKKEESDVKQEIQMLQNAIDFRNVKLRECMVPRTEITAIALTETIEDLRKCFIDSGHSKVLVYDETVDNIIGFVHSSDLFKNPQSIRSVTHTIPIIPETMLANNVLSMFIREHKSIALVVDEFGGTSGIVTMEDIIEEIFGEIDDEFDVEELTEKKINDNEYLFSARLEIDYLNEKYKIHLPESDEYETLGGFIINIHESIPSINEIIIRDKFRFIIAEASDTRIETVRLILDSKRD
jgi:CBS domain containing-hemolysin-like protein